MVTLVHGSPLSRDSSKATLRPRCHKTLLPVVLFQGNIPSTVAVVYVKDTVQCHRSEPYSTLQYSWCTLFAKGLNLSVLIFTQLEMYHIRSPVPQANSLLMLRSEKVGDSQSALFNSSYLSIRKSTFPRAKSHILRIFPNSQPCFSQHPQTGSALQMINNVHLASVLIKSYDVRLIGCLSASPGLHLIVKWNPE